jgi:hypothetical protein
MVDTTQPIAIDQPEQQTPVSIDSPDNNAYNIPLPQSILDERASKAYYGVGSNTNLTEPDIKQGIAQGKEAQVRQDAATQIDINKMKENKTQLSARLMSPEELAAFVKQTNPDSVFEEHYADQYLKSLNWPRDPLNMAQDSWLYNTILNDPEPYDYITRNGGSRSLAFTEFLKTMAQNAEVKTGVGNQVGEIIADLATLGFYSEARYRQQGLFSEGLGLGTNLHNQSVNLYYQALTDFDSAKKRAQDTYNYLAKTDPVLGYHWLKAMIGQAQNDSTFDDIMTAFNVFAPGVALTAKDATSVAKTIKATKDMVRLPEASIPPKVSAPAQAGNVAESAVQKTLKDRLNQFSDQYDPIQSLKERLASVYDIDKTAAASDPGRLGREMANRLSDLSDAQRDRMIATAMESNRVNKTPVSTTIEAQIKIDQKNLADQHRGIDNQILNVSEPIYIPGLNNHAYNIQIGTHDGDLFRSVEEARANAKLNGLIVKGDLIETPENLLAQTRLNNLVKAFESAASKANTPEGAAKARSMAELMRQRIQALPRHEGVTIEEVPGGLKTATKEPGLQINPNILKRMKEEQRSTSESSGKPSSGFVRFYHGGPPE